MPLAALEAEQFRANRLLYPRAESVGGPLKSVKD
jgi:hypothetical protein